jgi:hypothetical protein
MFPKIYSSLISWAMEPWAFWLLYIDLLADAKNHQTPIEIVFPQSLEIYTQGENSTSIALFSINGPSQCSGLRDSAFRCGFPPRKEGLSGPESAVLPMML